MKKANLKFSRILALALVFLLALSAVIPAFAAPDDQDNLTVRIRNNTGLPSMNKEQFKVYQIFKGSPNREGDKQSNEWEALNWNNYSLADIEWGESMYTNSMLNPNIVTTLKTYLQIADWAKVGQDGANVFYDWATKKNPEGTAAELAAILAEHNDNEFMQHFAQTILDTPGFHPVTLPKPTVEGETNPKVVNDASDSSKDSLTYTLPSAGYYLFAEDTSHATTDDDDHDYAISEYMLAVIGEQDILLKASVPDVDKDIVVGSEDKKGDAAGVGDKVTFKLTGTLPKNFNDYSYYEYTFTDTLSKGLQFLKGDTANELSNLTVTITLTVKGAMEGTTEVKSYRIDLDKLINSKFSTPEQEGKEYPDGYDDPKLTLDKAQIYLQSNDDGTTSLWVDFRDLRRVKGQLLAAGEPTGDYDVLPWNNAVNINETAQIVVEYKATVTEDALIGVEGNPNKVDLTFSNDPNNRSQGKTIEKKVRVYAFGLDLKKVGSDSGPADGLGGAGFVLKNADGTKYAEFKNQWILTVKDAEGHTTQTFYDSKELADEAAKQPDVGNDPKVEGPIRRLTGWANADTVTNLIKTYNDAVTALENASDSEKAAKQTAVNTAKEALKNYLLESAEKTGKIPDIYGLDEGTYTLVEVITPAGYNTMDDFGFSIAANIDDNGILTKVTYTHDGKSIVYKSNYTEGDAELPAGADKDSMIAQFKSGLLPQTLVNQKAPFLPFTGGMGTMIFYVLGVTLIAGAITYLVVVTKKRKKAEENA